MSRIRLEYWEAMKNEVPLGIFDLYVQQKYGKPWYQTTLPYVFTDSTMISLEKSLYIGNTENLATLMFIVTLLDDFSAVEISSRSRQQQYRQNQMLTEQVTQVLEQASHAQSTLNNSCQQELVQPLLVGMQVGGGEQDTPCSFLPPTILNLRLRQSLAEVEDMRAGVYTPMREAQNSTLYFNTQFSSLYGSLTDPRHTPFFRPNTPTESIATRFGVSVSDVPIIVDTCVRTIELRTCVECENEHCTVSLIDSKDQWLADVLRIQRTGGRLIVDKSKDFSDVVEASEYIESELQVSLPAGVLSGGSGVRVSQSSHLVLSLGASQDQRFLIQDSYVFPADNSLGTLPELVGNIKFKVVPMTDASRSCLVATRVENTDNYYVILYNRDNIKKIQSCASAGNHTYNENVFLNYIMVKVPLDQLGFLNCTHPVLASDGKGVVGFVPLPSASQGGLDTLSWKTFPVPPPRWQDLTIRHKLVSNPALPDGSSNNTIDWISEELALFSYNEITSLSLASAYPSPMQLQTNARSYALDGVLTHN